MVFTPFLLRLSQIRDLLLSVSSRKHKYTISALIPIFKSLRGQDRKKWEDTNIIWLICKVRIIIIYSSQDFQEVNEIIPVKHWALGLDGEKSHKRWPLLLLRRVGDPQFTMSKWDRERLNNVARHVMKRETEPSFQTFMIITWEGEGKWGTTGERANPQSATTDSVHHRASLTSVLISKDCYNYYRLSALKRQIFLLSVLDARSLRSRC